MAAYDKYGSGGSVDSIVPSRPKLQTGTMHLNVEPPHSTIAASLMSKEPSLYTAVSIGMVQRTETEHQRVSQEKGMASQYPEYSARTCEPVFLLPDSRTGGSTIPSWHEMTNGSVSVFSNLNIKRLSPEQVALMSQGKTHQAIVAKQIEDQLIWKGVMDPYDSAQDTGGGNSTAQIFGPVSRNNTGSSYSPTGDLLEWVVLPPHEFVTAPLTDEHKKYRPIAVLRPYKRDSLTDGTVTEALVTMLKSELQSRQTEFKFDTATDDVSIEKQLDLFVSGFTDKMSREHAPLDPLATRIMRFFVANHRVTSDGTFRDVFTFYIDKLKPKKWLELIRAVTSLADYDQRRIVASTLTASIPNGYQETLLIPRLYA